MIAPPAAGSAGIGTVLEVLAAVAPLVAEPSVRAEQTSQRLSGQRVVLLEARPPWMRVRGVDGYDGWMHEGYLTGAPFGATLVSPDARRISLGCMLRGETGLRSLPAGARVADDAVVVAGEALSPASLATRHPPEPEAIARSAIYLFAGTPYQWGGISPWGADCSGFVQSIFGLHGTLLPRDAWQQCELGCDAGLDIAALRPADLLFFSERPDSRISHVAVALGESRLAHLALGRGGHAVESLDRTDDCYVGRLRQQLRAVRRVLP